MMPIESQGESISSLQRTPGPKEARTKARSPRSFAHLFVLTASSWGRAQLNAVFCRHERLLA